MNGRVYDPDLGRFLSPDPFIQQGANAQSFNRYTYVNNNPLSYTDPSGFFFKKLFKKIGKLFVKGIKSLFKQFVRGLKNTFSPQNLLAAAAFVGCNAVAPGSGSACAAAASAGYTAAGGGSIIEVLHSAISAYNTAQAFQTGQVPTGASAQAEDIASIAKGVEEDLKRRNGNERRADPPVLRKTAVFGSGKFLNGAVSYAFNALFPAAQAADSGYSSERRGWHDYIVDNLICPANLACTAKEIADQLSRHAYPGQDPSKPVEDGDINLVYDPRYDPSPPGGWVRTDVSNDGLTVVNTTLSWRHVFHDGQIVRRAYRTRDGAWRVETRGTGNNVIPGAATVNTVEGPEIFDHVDQGLRSNIEAHR